MPLSKKQVLAILNASSISLGEARKMIVVAERVAAEEVKQPMCIAIVDAGGNLVSFSRMDGAWMGSIDIAIDKAFTARAFDVSTEDLAKDAQPGAQFYGIQNSNSGRVMVFAGGLPIKKDGVVVGAIGVSGGTGEQDAKVAAAGLSEFGRG